MLDEILRDVDMSIEVTVGGRIERECWMDIGICLVAARCLVSVHAADVPVRPSRYTRSSGDVARGCLEEVEFVGRVAVDRAGEEDQEH